MAWPKGKPRGPQSVAHKATRGKAISAGQTKRFQSTAAREAMSKAITKLWHAGERASELTGSRSRRISISVSAEDWHYLHWMSKAAGGGSIGALVREAITDSRKDLAEFLSEQGIAPGWEADDEPE